MEKADDMYRELDKLLPGKVAVWTTDHDVSCKAPTKVMTPAATFSKDDLQNYPVAVVTHAFFSGKGSHNARQVLHQGRLRRRAFTVIDERIDEVIVYDVAYSAAEKVREFVMASERHAETIGPHMDELVKFMFARSFGGRDIEKPTDDEAWSAAERLQWCTTGDASAFVRANPGITDAVPVFGFGRALASGYAFIARNSGGEKTTRYIGYENHLKIDAGTMLLDATQGPP
jgi:hypothetical protein